MPTWKTVFVAAVSSAALMGTIVHHVGRGGDKVLASHAMDARQPTSSVTNPITPSDIDRIAARPDGEHGWGPVRTVDW
jgi:hypothetical protein